MPRIPHSMVTAAGPGPAPDHRARSRGVATDRRVRADASAPTLGLRELAPLPPDKADTGFTLEDEQIKRRRLAHEARQKAMRLPAVVGLMVEEME
jgi:hypothetical protein